MPPRKLNLPPLTAPKRLTGRMSKHTPQDLRDDRAAWAANAGRAGYSSVAVGKALGIKQRCAYRIMKQGGWDAWAYLRERYRMEPESDPFKP